MNNGKHIILTSLISENLSNPRHQCAALRSENQLNPL